MADIERSVAPFWLSASTPVLLVTNSEPSGPNAMADTSFSFPAGPAIELPEKAYGDCAGGRT